MPLFWRCWKEGSDIPGRKLGLLTIGVNEVSLSIPSRRQTDCHAFSVFTVMGFVHLSPIFLKSLKNNKSCNLHFDKHDSMSSHVEELLFCTHSDTNLKSAHSWYILMFGKSNHLQNLAAAVPSFLTWVYNYSIKKELSQLFKSFRTQFKKMARESFEWGKATWVTHSFF